MAKKLVTYTSEQRTGYPWISIEEMAALDPQPNYKLNLIGEHLETNTQMFVMTAPSSADFPSSGYSVVTSIDGYSTLDRRNEITKGYIVRSEYSESEEMKILRDASAGRNTSEFTEYDEFVQLIP